MFSPAVVIGAICVYALALFVIAQLSERTEIGRRWAAHPAVYALGLAVYCTTWTYYGSVGKASAGGMGFLPVYLGPTLGLLLGGSIFQRIVRLKQAHRITSIADFVSARYGKSQLIAAMVTIILMVGIVPYVGLQLKALSSTFAIMTTAPGADASAMVSWFNPIIVVLMIVFTITFGIRHLDPTERHPGMVVSLAAESIIKLAAFLAAGVFIVGLAFGGFGDFLDHFASSPPELPMMGQSSPSEVLVWCTVGLLSMSAFAFLPRQFHVGVIENSDDRHVQTARWMTPLYLILINVFVVPIALAGKHMGLDGVTGDQFVLALPIHAGASALSMAVFIGGFSAAIGMIMIESMTMATMISNHLLMPLIQRVPGLSGLRRHMLYARWAAAAAFITAGYGFEVGIGGSYMLVAIGLISFASAFLLTPVILAGLFWRAASRGGAVLGLGAGFITWFYTLLMPTFVKSGWLPEHLLTDGPLGIAMLRPEALFGWEGVPSLPHGVIWSAGITTACFVLGSLLWPADREERQLTEQFLDIDADQFGHLDDSEASISAAEKRAATAALLAQYYPEAEVGHLVDRCLDSIGCADKEMLTVVNFAELYNEVERTLAGAIGAASAHGVLKEQWGTIDRKDARALAREYARMMARMKLSPKEIRQRIDYQAERESLLNDQFQELKKYSDGLEDKVRERTREIQTILDNVTFGFLVVGHDLAIREGFTQSCHELFGGHVEAGARLDALLGLDDNSRMMLELGFDEIYEDLMPEALLVAQLPSRFEQQGGRVLHLEARVIRDGDGAVDSLLMTVSDITALEAAQKESMQNRVLISLLQQKDAFCSFLQDTREQLHAAQHAVKENDRVVVRRVVHTIKGNTAIYGIHNIAQLIHDIEEDDPIEEAELDRIRGAFRGFLEANAEVLQLDFDNPTSAGLQLSSAHVQQLRSMLNHSDSDQRAFRSWAAEVIQKPASQVLGPLEPFVERLAERLGKSVSFTIEGADTLVDANTVRPVFLNLTHLLRNSIDHGIEAPEDRGDKPAEAQVWLKIEDDGAQWVLTLSDDGRGIDTGRLIDKCLRAGALSEPEAAAMTHEQRLQLIFRDGLSSADEATDISGRGVGMSAVKMTVESLGGQIKLWSLPHRGTQFTLTIPKPEVFALAS